MTTSMKYGVGGLLLCLLAPAAWAEDDAALDEVTMEVVGDPEADEHEYVDEIELPTEAAPSARDSADFGRETADEARERAREEGRAFGQSTAQEARKLGRDAGNAAKSGNGAGAGPPDDLPVQVP